MRRIRDQVDVDTGRDVAAPRRLERLTHRRVPGGAATLPFGGLAADPMVEQGLLIARIVQVTVWGAPIHSPLVGTKSGALTSATPSPTGPPIALIHLAPTASERSWRATASVRRRRSLQFFLRLRVQHNSAFSRRRRFSLRLHRHERRLSRRPAFLRGGAALNGIA